MLQGDRHQDESTDPIDRRSGSDRRRRFSPRLRERRSGFDRRDLHSSGPRAAFNRALLSVGRTTLRFWTVLATIVVFNFVDLMLTVRALNMGAEEANPVMRTLFWTHPLTAASVKLGVVAFVVLGLQRLRRYRDALLVSLVLLIGFTALMFYHAAFAMGWIG